MNTRLSVFVPLPRNLPSPLAHSSINQYSYYPAIHFCPSTFSFVRFHSRITVPFFICRDYIAVFRSVRPSVAVKWQGPL
jgi:hypothetical protein